jgi:toxin-antitoxin system PIN domain toxin
MIHLLDINVLIALCDPAHPHAASARRFFTAGLPRQGWATCPLVENGFLRIFGSRTYPGGPGSTHAARHILSGLLASPGHQFWSDDLTLTDMRTFPGLPASADLTDIYLLALAVKHRARFATFDTSIDASLVPGGPAAYHVVQG